MKKIYQSRLTYYSMCIPYKEGFKHVEFKGGSFSGGISSPSQFITEDDEVMKGIEGGNSFRDRKVWLYKTEGEPIKVKIPVKEPIAPVKEEVKEPIKVEIPKVEAPVTPPVEPVIIPPVPEVSKVEPTPYTGITNGQKAKEKLIELGIDIPFIVNVGVTIAKAKENNISFPDWEAFNK